MASIKSCLQVQSLIATLGLLSKSSSLRNSTVERIGGKRIQLALHTNPAPRDAGLHYMEAETSVNLTRLFQLFNVDKKECGYDPRPLVVQVHRDFSDAIEGGRRAVFPGPSAGLSAYDAERLHNAAGHGLRGVAGQDCGLPA